MDPKFLAYFEAVGAGAVLAGAQAAYQAVGSNGVVTYQPIVAAFILGAVGYALAALRWLQTPPPVPTPPLPALPDIHVHLPGSTTTVTTPPVVAEAPTPQHPPV